MPSDSETGFRLCVSALLDLTQAVLQLNDGFIAEDKIDCLRNVSEILNSLVLELEDDERPTT